MESRLRDPSQSPTTGEALIRLTDVRKIFPGGAVALDRASLEVRPHEFIVVVGPSGAGKSTMLRCMNLLVRPTSGRLEVAGELIHGEKGAQLRSVRGRVGMIFQQFGLVGRLSVFQNVLAGRLRFHTLDSPRARRVTRLILPCFAWLAAVIAAGAIMDVPDLLLWAAALAAACLTGAWCVLWCVTVGPSVVRFFPAADKRAAMDALRTVGIAHLAGRRADQLSGGQQQRVAIARTLAQDPMVVLADEPIASLDPVSAEAVMDALRAINIERGIPVVVNLHQVDVARRYATRVIGMSAGRIVYDGAPEGLTPAVIDRIYRGDESQTANAPVQNAAGAEHNQPDHHPRSAPGVPLKEQAWLPSPAG